MTVNIPIGVIEIQLETIELKLDRLIDEMRLLKSRTIAFDTSAPFRHLECVPRLFSNWPEGARAGRDGGGPVGARWACDGW